MFKPKLGVSLHTLSKELTDDVREAVNLSHIATFEVFADLFTHGDNANTRRLLKEMLASGGRRAASIHARFGGACDFSNLDETAFRNALKEAHASIALAVEYDAPIIVVHASAEPIPILPEQRDQRLAQARRALAELADTCRMKHKKIAVELLPRTCLGNTVSELLGLIDGFGEETMGVCLDVNHLMDRYRDLSSVILRLKRRLIALHLSDYDGIDEKHWLPGSGVIDWSACIKALRAADYSGPFNYECDFGGKTPSESIKMLEDNFDWLCKF